MKIYANFLLVCFSLVLFSCTEVEQPKKTYHQHLSKHEPVDRYLDFRLGVTHDDFSFEKYLSALQDVKSLQKRSDTPGFDKAWKVAGPYTAGGRVNVLEINPDNPNEVFIGFSRGGLWHTTDKGETWTDIGRNFTFPSIGAIYLDNENDRLWVGTGDPNISGYFYVGDGVYFSDDRGQTWISSGLQETGIVNDIEVDPTNSDIIYVATMGRPYNADQDRGLYKSIDGGQTWNQILFDDPTAGISAVHLNPLDPNILFATGWNRQRTLTSSTIRGDQAILWRSNDAGNTWQNMQPQVGYPLPAGRLAFAISPQDTNYMYMSVVDSTNAFGGFYRSTNAGLDWELTADRSSPNSGLNESPMGGFGWFFGETRVDPTDKDHVWMLAVNLWQSFDGGFTWERDVDTDDFDFTHADNHALEVGPDNVVWKGTDGGAYTRDLDDDLWSDAEDLPTNLVYRIADSPFDSTVFGIGMQDNGTYLQTQDNPFPWEKFFGGDGFQTVFFDEDEEIIIAETQNGRLWQIEIGSGFVEEITPFDSEEPRYWDTPIAFRYDSASRETYLLTGSNRAYEGVSSFPFFETNSQLLTAVDSNSRSVITAAHISKTLTRYIGSSDGLIWRKREGESNWSRLRTRETPRYITDITTSDDNPEVVYFTMSEYRSGNNTPYIMRSGNEGDDFERLQGDMPQLGVNSILSIPGSNDSLIIIGTDAGVYASVNQGINYERLGVAMTNVPVFDLTFEPQSQRIVAATFGQSVQSYPLKQLLQTTVFTDNRNVVFDRNAELIVYPNPVQEKLCIKTVLLEPNRKTEVSVLDMQGRIIKTWTFAVGNTKLETCLDLPSQIAAGQYVVRIKNRHEISTKKIVIE